MKVAGTLAFLAVVATRLWAQCDLEKIEPTTGAGGNFGSSVAVCGDRLYVGDFHANTYGARSGDAFVYRLENGAWVMEAQLVAPGISASDWYGWGGDIDGDYLAVGAGQPSGTGPGYVWMFHRTGTTWTPQQKLMGSGAPGNAQFGATLDLEGDLLIVNALRIDGSGGGGYVFEREGDTWSEVAILRALDPASPDSVAGVAISGDVAVVDSRYDHELDFQSGAAFVYRHHSEGWEFEQKILASNGGYRDWFGWQSLSTDGNRIIAGARHNDAAGPDSGAAYVFEQIDGVWQETAMLLGSDTGPGDQLGYAVWLHGDWALVGAGTADPEGVTSGEAYLFECIGGTWIERRKYQAFDGASGDMFGAFVRADGRNVVLGAFLDDNPAGVDAGAVYVVPLPTSARFSSSRTLGVGSLTVSFQDLSLGNVTSYLWDFGDGFLSTVQNPLYTYHTPGTYSVTLTVDGPCGMSSETKVDYIQVLPRPRLPWFGPLPTDVGIVGP